MGSGKRLRLTMQLATFASDRKEAIVDTKSLDKQGKAHLQFYHNFMLASKICIIAIVATLVIMAATLI